MKVSIFTPTHNTKYLQRLYQTIRRQTYQNWEWVICPNNGAIVDIKDDPRVKIYPCSGSTNIGYLKKYACSKCIGDVVMEVDHDDELFENVDRNNQR